MLSDDVVGVTPKGIVGWREWASLPELGIEAVKVKVDTGARTSTLHTFRLETFDRDGIEMVRFAVHPLQRRQDTVVEAVAQVYDTRWISDSGGHRERRIIIRTPVRLGSDSWPIEISLTDRDTMMFRMLLGRSAISGRYQVDAEQSYLVGHKPRRRKHKHKSKEG